MGCDGVGQVDFTIEKWRRGFGRKWSGGHREKWGRKKKSGEEKKKEKERKKEKMMRASNWSNTQQKISFYNT
jgi:hypothetical protein